jgi:hypothetical protein
MEADFRVASEHSGENVNLVALNFELPNGRATPFRITNRNAKL